MHSTAARGLRAPGASITRRAQAPGGGHVLRPPLKWAGGKRWQVPHLRGLWFPHRHRRFVEPFCGGLAVTLGLMPAAALLNDVNPHVINFYRWLKHGLRIALPMKNERDTFYAYRARFNDLLRERKAEGAEAAALFYYLNRTGYNGLCRFNNSGEFNVPFGRYNRIEYRLEFGDWQRAFERFEFASVDFERLSVAPDDFIYADPPYDVAFTHYSRGGFAWEEQARTAEWLARHPGPVILSNQRTDRIETLYRKLGFRLMSLTGPRLISCKGDRTPAEEVLATRNI